MCIAEFGSIFRVQLGRGAAWAEPKVTGEQGLVSLRGFHDGSSTGNIRGA